MASSDLLCRLLRTVEHHAASEVELPVLEAAGSDGVTEAAVRRSASAAERQQLRDQCLLTAHGVHAEAATLFLEGGCAVLCEKSPEIFAHMHTEDKLDNTLTFINVVSINDASMTSLTSSC